MNKDFITYDTQAIERPPSAATHTRGEQGVLRMTSILFAVGCMALLDRPSKGQFKMPDETINQDMARLDWLEAQGDLGRILIDPDLEGSRVIIWNSFGAEGDPVRFGKLLTELSNVPKSKRSNARHHAGDEP